MINPTKHWADRDEADEIAAQIAADFSLTLDETQARNTTYAVFTDNWGRRVYYHDEYSKRNNLLTFVERPYSEDMSAQLPELVGLLSREGLSEVVDTQNRIWHLINEEWVCTGKVETEPLEQLPQLTLPWNTHES